MSRAGLALAEVLVATASALVVVALVASTLPVHARAFTGGRDRQELRSSLRRIADAVVREARGLGFDPIENGVDPAAFDGLADGLAVAQTGRLELHSDNHGAGGSGAPNDRLETASDERIAFAWSAATRGVTQSIGDLNVGLAQGARMASDGFRVRYFDVCGAELATPVAGLTAADRRAVAALEVGVTGEHVGVGGEETVTTTIVLRNRRHLRCPFGAAS